MRVAAALMMLGTAFAVATPAAEADPQNLGVIVSELPALVSELPAALSALGPQLPGELSAFIQQYAPTAVVSDLPAILATNLAALENLALGAIPAGALTPAESSAVWAASPPIFTQLEADIDQYLASLPQTMSVAALPGLIESNLGAVATDLVEAASALEPEISAILTSVEGIATGLGTVTPMASGMTMTASASNGTSFTAPSIPVATNAANNHGVNKELVGTAAVVGAIGILGAML